MSTACTTDHHYTAMFRYLPNDQAAGGRHRCAGCAYDRGFEHGRRRAESPHLDLESLPLSVAVKHKSPHAAWALGYGHGVKRSYE